MSLPHAFVGQMCLHLPQTWTSFPFSSAESTLAPSSRVYGGTHGFRQLLRQVLDGLPVGNTGGSRWKEARDDHQSDLHANIPHRFWPGEESGMGSHDPVSDTDVPEAKHFFGDFFMQRQIPECCQGKLASFGTSCVPSSGRRFEHGRLPPSTVHCWERKKTSWRHPFCAYS